MATTSFKDADKPAVKPEPQALVKATPAAVAQANSFGTSQVEGEFTKRDIAVPYLALGQKSGNLCDEHPEWVGSFIYDKGICLGAEINLIFCSLRKSYEEVREYGDPILPKRFIARQEYLAQGFSDTQVRDVGEFDVLIESPNPELEDLATITADGKHYLPGRWAVRSTAYGKTVGIVLKDLGTWLHGKLHNGVYKVSSLKKTDGKNSWHIPVLKTAGKTPADLLSQIEARL